MKTNRKYRKLTQKKYELITRLTEWTDKLKRAQKQKDHQKVKQIENTIRQLEKNLIEVLKQIEELRK